MLYVGPSTRAVLEPRSLRAGFTLSETPAANGEKTKGTWGLGVPKDLAGCCPRESSAGDIKGVWGVGGISEGRGDRGEKHRLDVSRRNPRSRRKEAGKGARRIRKKQKIRSMVTFSSVSRHWEKVRQA